MADGSLLIVGGSNDRAQLGAAWLFDAEGQLLLGLVNPPELPRSEHTATVLQSGREVLIVGGRLEGSAEASCSVLLFDGREFRRASPLPETACRSRHTATLLPNGSVLVAGGLGRELNAEAYLNSALVYEPGADDPAAGSWRSLPMMNARRAGHRAALLGPYLVVVGGTNLCQPLHSVEAFDTRLGGDDAREWRPLDDMSMARKEFELTPLGASTLLVSGGLTLRDQVSQTSELLSARANGDTCHEGQLCASGYCVDGVCCDAECEGPCRSCSLLGSEGSCMPLADGSDGDPGCKDGLTCRSGACLEACVSHAECQSEHYCDAPACVPKKPLGERCVEGAECVSAQCADGVCCEASCFGACEHCNELGRCQAIQYGSPGKEHPTCRATIHSPQCSPVCDGQQRDACVIPVGNPCFEATCEGNTYLTESRCTDTGTCSARLRFDCQGYTCDALNGCRKSCRSDLDCSENFLCEAGHCVSAAASCTERGYASQAPRGTPVECTPYFCDERTGSCASECSATAECQRPFVCDTDSHACVVPRGPSCSFQGAADRSAEAAYRRSICLSSALWLAIVFLRRLENKGRMRAKADARLK